jgi:hypothetical protein
MMNPRTSSLRPTLAAAVAVSGMLALPAHAHRWGAREGDRHDHRPRR